MAAAALFAACGERGEGGTSPAPGFRHNVALEFDGNLTSSCEVQSFQACPEAPFGTGVTPGTPISLRVTYDSATPPVHILNLEDQHVVRYYGVTVQLTVGGDTLPVETTPSTYIEIASTPDTYTVLVTMSRGIDGGTVAGLSVDYAIAELEITPSRHPDVSLPTHGSEFAAALAARPFSIALKHHTDPDLASFGLVAPGSVVMGEITAVRNR